MAMMQTRWDGPGVFVTGTDTAVGKTVFACALLRAYSERGLRAVGMKPVAAGIESGRAANSDVEALVASGNVDAAPADRNPFAFVPEIAPHLAAADADVVIDIAAIRAAYDRLAARADRVVVEGAGGVLVPLNARQDMLDVAVALSLPVVLVVGMRLGCLNHALLSAHAIRARGLVMAGWVANVLHPAMARLDQNVATLDEWLSAPRIARIEWGGAHAPAWGLGVEFGERDAWL
jgi:dethiobiotin synthetase